MSANDTTNHRFLPSFASLGIAILFWSIVPLLLKYFTHLLDAWMVNGLRYTFAALFWLPFVLRHRRNIPPGRNIWRDAIPPAACHTVGQILFGFTPYFNDATVINFVSRVSFLFVTLFGFIMLRDERPLARDPFFWIGVAGTFVGLVVMYVGGLGTRSTSARGMLLLVMTAAFWGLYAVLVGKFMRGYSVRLAFGAVSLYTAPCLFTLMFVVGNWKPILHLDAVHWFLIWGSAIAGIALGHVLFYNAIQALGPITSEGSLLLIPFVTSLLAFFVLEERIGRLQWIGGFVVVLGCLFLVLAKRRFGRRVEMVAPEERDGNLRLKPETRV